jgi:hypothetical protein
MAILPYMRQLPQDFYRNNYPAPVAVAAVPVVAEPIASFPIAELGTPLPPVTGGGIPEAPTDGSTNARRNAAWTSTWDGGAF